MKIKDEHILLKGLERGDKSSFQELFGRYWNKICSFITVIVKDRSVAEDLAQNLFLKIWESRHRLSNVKSLDAYLFSSSRNAAMDYLRKLEIDSRFVQEESLIMKDACVNQIIQHDADIIQERISACLEKMPEQRRLCYELSRKEHLTNKEIADMLNLSVRTVEHHISFALKSLRDSISQDFS